MIWIFVDNMLTDVDCLPRETLLVLITLENFFFTKNKFYTTSVNKMAGRSIENAVNKEDVVCFLKAENII